VNEDLLPLVAVALVACSRRVVEFSRGRLRIGRTVAGLPDERGVAVLELVLLVPAVLVMVFVVVGLGRMGMARENIDAAARDAARAGSIARTAGDAEAAATAAANDALGSHNITCSGMSLSVDTSDFRPGGWVRVDLSCTVSLSDLSGMWTPGTKTMQARGLAVVDTYRRAG
jgi:hypothetical protein